MPRLSFSKAALHKEDAQLKRFKQYLPSLDLKRQQLVVERTKAMVQLTDTQTQIERCYARVKEQLPMLSNEHVDMGGLVTIRQVEMSEENVVGVKLPYLKQIEIQSEPYSLLSKPHWVDFLVVQLKEMLELKIKLDVEQKRVEILQQAVNKVTQRVNLFDKVLIPRAQQNIRKIRIFLSDTERAAVIRAKITKNKRLKGAF
ncbi:MAG: V-type ATP synthase subunit D [Methylococcaceae bacterium]|nr:V-type ATP synthase subunit D [Methylococcaceae bacterium]